MKKLLIGLLVLGSFSSFACDYFTTNAFNAPNGLVVSMLTVDSNGDVQPHQISNPHLVQKIPGVAGAYKATTLGTDMVVADIVGETVKKISAITNYETGEKKQYVLMEDMSLTLTFTELGSGECGLSISNTKDQTIRKAKKLVAYHNSDNGATIGKRYLFENDRYGNSRIEVRVLGVKLK